MAIGQKRHTKKQAKKNILYYNKIFSIIFSALMPSTIKSAAPHFSPNNYFSNKILNIIKPVMI